MTKKYVFVFFIFMIVSLLTPPAFPQTGGLPNNIAIEVEFKETGSRAVKAGPLGPFENRRSSEYIKQFIVVSDGMTGSIRVGEDVPFIEYYSRYLLHHGYIESYETVFKEIGTKLMVTPKIRGNSIEVSLTPQISYLSGGRRNAISVTELTTSVIIPNGQSMSIGGLIKDEDFKSYFFKTKTASSLDIILTPRIR
ncbi:MAG: hypothetical protein ISS26_04745 [Candidatus Omnitrophica bacterium]|nr:hypothetical protein [Candidatus Omnitrophota bacterium]